MRKLTILFAAFLLMGTQLFAEDVEIEESQLKYRLDTENTTATVISYTSNIIYADIPEKVEYENVSYTVTTIGADAFYWCTSLEYVQISSTVTSIEQAAFFKCTKLKMVTFHGNLCQNNIASGVFLECGNKDDRRNNPRLILPDSWGNRYLPEDDITPWYGGYFNVNRIFSIEVHKEETIAEIEAEVAKVSDWSEVELSVINEHKSNINHWEATRSIIDNNRSLAFSYMAQHENRQSALAAIDLAMGDYSTSAALHALLATEIDAINAATDEQTITTNRDAAIAKLPFMIAVYVEAKTELLGEMGEPCEDCPAIEVTKGDKTIILYNPESATFKKAE